MNKLTLILALALVSTHLFSQSIALPITKERKRYFQEGEKLTYKELKSILMENEAAQPEFQEFKKMNSISSPLLIATGVCVFAAGYTSLKSSMDQKEALDNGQIKSTEVKGLGFAIAGLGFALVNIPFALKGKKHLDNSVNAYNNSLNESRKDEVEFKFVLNSNGVGVRMTF